MSTNPSLVSVLTGWQFDPSVILGLLLTGLVYIVGWRELARRGRIGRLVKPRHAVLFGAGLFSILLALLSPIDHLSDRLFAVHMFQHLLLLMIAPPLLLLGKPIPVLLVGAPRPLVRRVARAHARTTWFHGLTRWLTNPVVAWTLSAAAMLVWHLPALYQRALLNPGVHLLEHLCYLITGILFWWVVLQPAPGPARLGYGWRLLYTGTAMLPGGGLGMFFLLATAPTYSFYAALPRLWGISAMDDQALAGLIMGLLGDSILIGVGFWLFVSLMNRVEQREIAGSAALAAMLQEGRLPATE